METPIHVAITRRVRAGCEKRFEQEILQFFVESTSFPGTLGAQLIRPLPGSGDNTYGIIRSFSSKQALDGFYASETFSNWEDNVASLVEGGFRRTPLHGLEAFFHDSGRQAHPPKWKMAIATWLGVWPTVFVVSQLFGPSFGRLHPFFSTALVTLIVVVLLTWLVMPQLTKLLRPWLIPEKVDQGAPRRNDEKRNSPL